MRAGIIASGLFLGTALTSVANAQTVIERTVTREPVETTVTQTPGGTVVTRRPLGVAETVAPRAITTTTTRETVRRAEVTRTARRVRPMTTRHVSARPASRMTTVQRRTTQRLALTPAERHIVYQTIVERDVQPVQRVVPAAPYAVPQAQYVVPRPPYVAPQSPLINAQVALPTAPPVLAQDEIVAAPTYAIGSVLPTSVPLYAVPQDVALRVPAIDRYSYAYVGGRAYLVDPTTGMVVEDVTE
jgi:hypothetical protein